MSTLNQSTSSLDVGNTFTDLLAGLSALLQAIPLIGGLFKGKTVHIPYETCVAKSQEIGAQLMGVYNLLPSAVAKNEFATHAKTFFEQQVLGRFDGWWDDAIKKDYATWTSKGWLSSQDTATYHYLSQPVFYFMFFEDATRVEQLFEDRYTTPMNTAVLVPAGKYMKDTSTGDIPKLEIGTKGTGAGGGLAGFLPMTGAVKWALLGVIAYVLYLAFKGKLKPL